jgi:hypothetical protein
VVSARHQRPYEFINTRMEFLEPKNLQWIMDPPVTELEAGAFAARAVPRADRYSGAFLGLGRLDSKPMPICLVDLSALAATLQFQRLAGTVVLVGVVPLRRPRLIASLIAYREFVSNRA